MHHIKCAILIYDYRSLTFKSENSKPFEDYPSKESLKKKKILEGHRWPELEILLLQPLQVLDSQPEAQVLLTIWTHCFSPFVVSSFVPSIRPGNIRLLFFLAALCKDLSILYSLAKLICINLLSYKLHINPFI